MSRAAEWYGAGLFLVYAVVLFAHPDAPSMTDYSNWTYQGVLLARHIRGFQDMAHRLKPYPVPNSAATLGVGMLSLVLPWKIAAKVWLCVEMRVSFGAVRYLARAAGASSMVWLVVPQAVFLGVNWWYGFLNFDLGVAWALVMAGLLLCRARGEVRRDGAIGAVLVLAFFTHMIPFAFCGLLVILYAAQLRRWRTLWQLAPGGVLTVWYLVGRYWVAADADGHAGMVVSVRNYSGAFWAYKVNSYAKSFGWVNPGDLNGSAALVVLGRALFAGFLVVNAALCCLMVWAIASEGVRAYKERRAERFLSTGVLLMLPVYWFAPGAALGVSDPGSRVLQVSLGLALVLACRSGGWRLRVAGACGVSLACAGVLLFARVGFGIAPAESNHGLPHAMVVFAHVPNHDQDLFYRALQDGNYEEPVFPTGMFLNRTAR